MKGRFTFVDDCRIFVGVRSNPFGHFLLVAGRSLAEPDVGLLRRDEDEAVVGVEGSGRQGDLF